MKRILIFAFFCLLSIQAFCQGNWKRDYYEDEFHEKMYDKPYIHNYAIHNNWLKLNIQVDQRGLVCLSLMEKQDGAPYLYSVSSPASISVKVKSTGKVLSCDAATCEDGRILFTGRNILDLIYAISEGNCKIVIKAHKYNESKSFLFSVNKEAAGFLSALHKWLFPDL